MDENEHDDVFDDDSLKKNWVRFTLPEIHWIFMN